MPEKFLELLAIFCAVSSFAYADIRHYKNRYYDNLPYQQPAPSYSVNSGMFSDTPAAEKKDTQAPQCQLEIACSGVNGRTPVRLPIQGPRGPAGARGSPGESGMRGEPGVPGMPGKDAPKTPSVGFYANLHNNTLVDPFVRNRKPIVLFELVTVNKGDGYNPKTGIFTAPISGVYQIYVKIAAQGERTAAVHVMKGYKNTVELLFPLWCQSIPEWGDTSNQVMVHLALGEKVWVQYRQFKVSDKVYRPIKTVACLIYVVTLVDRSSAIDEKADFIKR